MIFEVLLLVVVLVMAILAFVHSYVFRGRREALMLLIFGVGFGYLFPFIDINLFKQYIFHGRITVFNFPLHLGLAWYGLYYLGLCLGEYIVGAQRSAVWKSITAGLIFGLLEAQWDPTLLALGIMELFLPSFASYPFNFNPGLPMCHAYFGFAFTYAYYQLRESRHFPAASAIGLATLIVFPLSLMASVPMFEPIYRSVGERLDQWLLVIVDSVYFSSTFIIQGFIVAWWLRFVRRRLDGGTPAASQ